MATADLFSLAEHLGIPVNPLVEVCQRDARVLVAGFVGVSWDDLENGVGGVPPEAAGRAALEVGAELYHRKNTKNAVAQFASPDGAPVRIARDPLVAAYPILRPWVGGGFA